MTGVIIEAIYLGLMCIICCVPEKIENTPNDYDMYKDE